MRLRLTLAVVSLALPVCAQTRAYVASAGTPPQVAVRSFAAGPRPGTIPSGSYVLQPSGALGGAFAGNAISRPLGGGIVVHGPGGGPPAGTRQGRRRTGSSGVLAFASYVPQYVEVPEEVPVPVQSQPVIINQYFNSPAPDYRATALAQTPAPLVAQAGAGDPLAPPENYYLIAYRNRSIYAALAWWVEGDTLHYVTTQNTHNQASLDFIDMDKTRMLNQDRNIPFAIPGR